MQFHTKCAILKEFVQFKRGVLIRSVGAGKNQKINKRGGRLIFHPRVVTQGCRKVTKE